jgi:hypothetical protein
VLASHHSTQIKSPELISSKTFFKLPFTDYKPRDYHGKATGLSGYKQ